MSVATSDEQGMRNWAGDRVCTEGCFIIIIYFVGSSGKRPDNDNHQDNNVNTRRVH